MTRVSLLVFLAFCTAYSHQTAPCKRHHREHHGNMEQYHEMLFNDLARKVMDLDNKLKNSCERHSNAATKEVIGKKRYTIETPLPDYSEDDISITVRQKVLRIKAQKGDKHYTEMRILPNFVDLATAAYNFEDGLLEIVFPVKNGSSNTCDSSFGDTVTSIHKYDLFANGASPRFGFDGQDNFVSSVSATRVM